MHNRGDDERRANNGRFLKGLVFPCRLMPIPGTLLACAADLTPNPHSHRRAGASAARTCSPSGSPPFEGRGPSNDNHLNALVISVALWERRACAVRSRSTACSLYR